MMKTKTELGVGVEGVCSEGSALRATLDVTGRLKRNPYGMVAGAVGIGFVLGGGLFTRLTEKIFRVGLHIGLMAALPVLEKQLAQALTGSRSDTKKGE